MSAKTQKHPYHLVDPSPWPLAGAFSGGLLAVGAIFFLHYEQALWLYLGLGAVLLTMILWWKDVIKEAVKEKMHTPVVEIGLRYGMALFIASEVMFFASFFWAFFDASLFPKEAINFVWPPENIQTFDPLDLPLLNTVILLTSGTTVTWAHYAIRENKMKEVIQALTITVLLGISFSILQGVEYSHAPFGFKDGIYSSTFYMATGFHGLHVIIGTIFLAVCLFRAIAGNLSAKHHFGLEAAAWYWHFVDVVWIFLFVCIYCWGA